MTIYEALRELRGISVTLQVLREAVASPVLLRHLIQINNKLDHAIAHLEANEHINANKRAARSR